VLGQSRGYRPQEREYRARISVRFYLSAVWAYPGAWDELSVYPFVQSLHFYFLVFVPAELVFDIHDDVYNFKKEKCDQTVIKDTLYKHNKKS
jgi:hypothetical protein